MTRDVLKIRASVLAGYAKEFGLSKEMLIKLTGVVSIEEVAKSEKSTEELSAELAMKVIGLCIGGLKFTHENVRDYLSLSHIAQRYGVIMKVVDGKLKFSELKL